MTAPFVEHLTAGIAVSIWKCDSQGIPEYVAASKSRFLHLVI